MQGFVRDLVRFLRNTNVIEIGAAFALATVGVDFITTLVHSFVVAPVQNGDNEFVKFEDGTFVIGHRVFEWEDPLFQLLIALLVVAGVTMVVRWSRATLFGDEIFAECPHCLAEIPVGASVCSFCTREVAVTGAA